MKREVCDFLHVSVNLYVSTSANVQEPTSVKVQICLITVRFPPTPAHDISYWSFLSIGASMKIRKERDNLRQVKKNWPCSLSFPGITVGCQFIPTSALLTIRGNLHPLSSYLTAAQQWAQVLTLATCASFIMFVIRAKKF